MPQQKRKLPPEDAAASSAGAEPEPESGTEPSASAPKGSKKPKVEKRRARYRARCPKNILDRVDRVFQQRRVQDNSLRAFRKASEAHYLFANPDFSSLHANEKANNCEKCSKSWAQRVTCVHFYGDNLVKFSGNILLSRSTRS
jgi:hypothetical protein